MAKYKTSAEAQKAISDEIQAKAAELRKLDYYTTDKVLKPRVDQLKKEIDALQNKLMVEQTTQLGPVAGGLLRGGMGLASGITQGITGIMDLAGEAGKYLEKVAPSAYGKYRREDTALGQVFTPGMEATSREAAPGFNIPRATGAGITGGPVATGISTGTTAIDETLFEGAPVASLVTALTALGWAGTNAIRQAKETNNAAKFLKQIGADETNSLRDFIVAGQTSKDPQVAGVIQKLRNNPKYAEIFTELEKGAAGKTLKGMSPKATEGAIAEPVYNAYKEQIGRLYDNMFGAGVSAKFDKASKLAGDRTVEINNTIAKVDDLISEFSKSATDSSKASIAYLNRFKERMIGQPDAVGYVAKATSLDKIKGNLSSFGAEAAGAEGMLKNVARNDQERIAKVIFGSLKDDLAVAGANTTDKQLQAGVNLLQSAREDVRKGYDALNQFRARGLPKVFKDKEIYEFADEDLIKAFKGLNKKELAATKAILEVENPDALQRVQKSFYDEFVGSARKTLPDNTTGVDLQTLVNKYNSLDKAGRDQLAFALGTNSDEFASRMADAQKFYNYTMKQGGVVGKDTINPADVERGVYAGTGGNFGIAKITGAATEFYNNLKTGLSEDKLMKILITPEGKEFLRNATLSPNAQKTLQSFDKVIGTSLPKAQVGLIEVMKEAQPTPSTPVQAAPTEEWDIGPSTAPTTTPQAPAGEEWDVGPAQSFNKADLEQQIRTEANKQGLGQYADLFVKQAQAESALNPYAVSPKGAAGIFQFMPQTANELGITNPYDPSQSISGGIKYMGQLLKQYNNDPRTALAAYNWGMGNVNKQGLQNMPTETKNYISRILG